VQAIYEGDEVAARATDDANLDTASLLRDYSCSVGVTLKPRNAPSLVRVPDRVQQILERGRAYRDSRFICGAYNEREVEAGMLSAPSTMVAVENKPAYQADLTRARASKWRRATPRLHRRSEFGETTRDAQA
jgi:hypothetical protein